MPGQCRDAGQRIGERTAHPGVRQDDVVGVEKLGELAHDGELIGGQRLGVVRHEEREAEPSEVVGHRGTSLTLPREHRDDDHGQRRPDPRHRSDRARRAGQRVGEGVRERARADARQRQPRDHQEPAQPIGVGVPEPGQVVAHPA